jgi:hypothetical protein
MMQNLKILTTLIISAFNAVGQDSTLPPPEISIESGKSGIYKEYFFDERLQINDSTSLVIIIEDAQTQMATELGHRIYDDTAFIRKIKTRFYEEKEMVNGLITEEAHFCGHDMFFYSLSNGKMTYLNRLNSNCGLSEVSCQDLGILFESGRRMRVDTLTSLPKKYRKSRDDLFTENVIRSHYLNTQSWDICRTSKLPKLYYEGYFKTEITLDTMYSIEQNIENFIRQYSDDLENINWNIWSDNLQIKRFNYLSESTEIELYVYLKKEVFNEFKIFDIQTIVPIVNEDYKLLIYYDD